MSGSHQVALVFEDGVTRFVTTRPGETVADASYRNGINIPLDCRDGACGTCRCLAESGRFEAGDYLEDALTADEAAEGYALACQMRPASDLVLRVLATSSACKTRPAPIGATVSAVRPLSASTVALDVALEAPLAFLPGQYVNIAVPGGGQVRSYSFSSAPGAAAGSFLVRHIPGGAMSGWLASDARPGAPLAMTGPAGSFYLRAVERPVLMLAGGTGLAPFLSMLAEMAGGPPAHPVHLVYGVTRDEDLVELAALEAFEARVPGFTWTDCVADSVQGHARPGFVTDHLDPAHLHRGDVDVYVCGPPAMVEAVRAHFARAGIKPAAFHFEKFNPSGVVEAAA